MSTTTSLAATVSSQVPSLFTALIGMAVLVFGYLNWRYDLTRRYIKMLSGGRLKGFDGRIARFYYREFMSAFLVFFALALLYGSWSLVGR